MCHVIFRVIIERSVTTLSLGHVIGQLFGCPGWKIALRRATQGSRIMGQLHLTNNAVTRKSHIHYKWFLILMLSSKPGLTITRINSYRLNNIFQK